MLAFLLQLRWTCQPRRKGPASSPSCLRRALRAREPLAAQALTPCGPAQINFLRPVHILYYLTPEANFFKGGGEPQLGPALDMPDNTASGSRPALPSPGARRTRRPGL
jgi:hypothetical protein